MQINSSQVQCFLAVARTQNFTRAAQELYLSQPVLSRKIASLEEDLGLVLLNRSGRAVTLTAAGERMQAFFQRYVDELDSLMQELERERSAAAAQIRLGMFEGFDLSDFLHSLLFDFRLQHNNTTIQFESGTAMQLQQGLQNGQYDAVLMLRISAEAMEKIGLLSNSTMDDLFTVEKCLLYSDKNPLAEKQNPTVHDFREQTLLCLQNDQLPLSVVTSEKYFSTLGWKPKVQMLPSIDAVSMALLAGAGYAILDDSTRIFNYQTMRHIMLGDRHTVCLVTTNGANAASQVLREYLLRRYAL